MAKRLTLRMLGKLDKKTGRHADGDGLYLKVMSLERRFWTYRYRLAGKETEVKIGDYPETTIDEARAIHVQKRALVTHKKDPQAEKRQARAAAAESSASRAFEVAARQYVEHMEKRAVSKPENLQEWRRTLAALPASFRNLPIDRIGPMQVYEALTPIWTKTPETGRRLRSRIADVLDWTRGPDDTHPNPAAWTGWLKNKLGDPRKLGKLDRKTGERIPRGHHKALPYAEVPALVARLREDPDVAAKALEFTILTAKRTSEVIEMPRGEAAVAITTGVWTIPGERMKRKKGDVREQHDEPLAGRAIEILKERFEALGDQDFVFPGARRGRPVGGNAMLTVLRRMKVETTVHGFRSSFRDWAGNETSFPREVCEHALAHKVGDETERAYRRSDALKKRRELMELWARYLDGDRGANVIAIGEAAQR